MPIESSSVVASMPREDATASQALVRRAALVIVGRGLSRGWNSWCDLVAERAAAVASMELSVSRMLRVELLSALTRWSSRAEADALKRRAAQRLGLSYEGGFRQATVSKGRNRDTAWFAVIDAEWPALQAAFEAWLHPGNFDAAGQQKQSLSALTVSILALRDPVLRKLVLAR